VREGCLLNIQLSLNTATYAETTMQQKQAPLPGSIADRVTGALSADPIASAVSALLYAKSADDVLDALGVETLRANAEAAARFIADKPAGGRKIGLRQIELRGQPAHVLEILNDDMPFLVDSVLAEVQARNLPVELLLHPILLARRDAAGHLSAVSPPPAGGGAGLESYIWLLLPRLDDATAADLAASLPAILDDVRVAVLDWPAMRARVRAEMARLSSAKSETPADQVTEAVAFLDWLEAGNFTFLGMRGYDLAGDPETGELNAAPEPGLGILRDPTLQVLRRGNELVAMTPEVRRFFFSPAPLIITKANAVSRVHRRVHMDYVGVKTYGARGEPTGELRIVGLFTSQAYVRPAAEIPVLRHKVAAVLEAAGHPPASHDAKAITNILNNFPRDELFQIGVDRLKAWVNGILDLETRPRVRVFVRVDRFDRFVSALVFVPRDHFNSQVRERIGALLAASYQGRLVIFYPHFPIDGTLVRVQFIIGRYSGPTPLVDVADLERDVVEIVRTWSDRLVEAVRARGPGAEALLGKYLGAFSAGYSETFPPARALEDIQRIERLTPDMPVAVDFHREMDADGTRLHATLYRYGAPIMLSERLPILENLGFQAIDERSYTLMPKVAGETRSVSLHDMEIALAGGGTLELAQHDRRLEAAFLAVFHGHAENDGFNRLVLAAGLDWREVAILRAYGAYLRQLGSLFTRGYQAETLVRNAGITRDLIELFRVRFDPDRTDQPNRDAAQREIAARIEAALANVPSLDEDQILRLYLNLVTSTLRTSYFQQPADTSPAETVAFKIDSKALTLAPQPRPFREIWLSGPRVDGVHLRFAPIARGGIRWSDRAQDFRTEVLGLVRAQLVKNAVIVPSGAKGGFFPKRLPAGGKREEIQAEGVAAYRVFIAALLSVTDNIVDGRIVPPARVVRHDGDDAYLVVAADKGTATFSDIANAISEAHGFWLGDAFASGGSAGYDHKAMGITARGAWECVKRHFREQDIDIQSRPFTAAGVGDMSGDVFGNGMLLSRQTRLIAAFDHRDIFIDPAPDAARAHAERQRLFNLPRSSWADYDKSLISAGGGVFSRSAKSIPVSAQMRAVLDIDAPHVTPTELMRAVLKARVDLLFFGGIGTYIRASTETDQDAGDKANDALRITGADLRAKVVGEGANLGLTHKGRIEFAQRGGRVNTDFIDNSAGVNTSDQEVNIKIALVPAVRDGRLDLVKRNALLAAMTDEVAAGSLRNNYQQGLALSLSEAEGAAAAPDLALLMRSLEKAGLLARKLEALPSDAELMERARAGRGLTRPELATLLSYSKIALSHALLQTPFLDEPHLAVWLDTYFPVELRGVVQGDIARHDLRREIIATGVTNAVINRCGPAFVARMADETKAAPEAIAKAFLAVREIYALPELWRQLDALDNIVPGQMHLELYKATQDLLRSLVPWMLHERSVLGAYEGSVAHFKQGLQALTPALAAVMPPSLAQDVETRRGRYQAAQVPDALALAVARLPVLALAPVVTRLAQDTGATAEDAARVYLTIGEELKAADVATQAARIPVADSYDRIAITQALDAVTRAQEVLARTSLRDPAAAGAASTRRTIAAALGEITAGGPLTLARLVVAARQLEALLAMSAEGGA
jgi:glutamate dehydrogenase